jgi:ribosomal protein S18 acetylase RimI-like enzyme
VPTLSVRSLDLDDAADVALGYELVEEYVVFTAEEGRAHDHTSMDIEMLRKIIPDLRDFAGRYRGGAYLVASRGGEVAGGVGIARYDEHTCEMNRLWLRAPYRGSGAGRELVTASLDHARALGFERMVLDVVPFRTRAIALYRSFDFRDTEPIHEYPFEMLALGRAL